MYRAAIDSTFTGQFSSASRGWGEVWSRNRNRKQQQQRPLCNGRQNVAHRPRRARPPGGGRGRRHLGEARAQGPKGRQGVGDQFAARWQQDGTGGGDATAQRWRDPGRDHGEDGLATAHCPRVYGWCHEEGRIYRGVIQAARRRAYLSPQPVGILPPPVSPARLRPRRPSFLWARGAISPYGLSGAL